MKYRTPGHHVRHRSRRAARLAIAGLTALIATLGGCWPVTVSRIGPPVPARNKDCDLEVLERGETPDRPYRDVGMVQLDNCQDYLVPPCRTWLEEAACELGGHVAYLPEDVRPQGDFAPLTFRVLVAAYVAQLRPDPENDVVFKSLRCDPPCSEGESCVAGACRPAGEDCPESVELEAVGQQDRCVE